MDSYVDGASGKIGLLEKKLSSTAPLTSNYRGIFEVGSDQRRLFAPRPFSSIEFEVPVRYFRSAIFRRFFKLLELDSALVMCRDIAWQGTIA